MLRNFATNVARVACVTAAAYIFVRLGDSWAAAWVKHPWGIGAEPGFRGEGMALTVFAAIIICVVPALRLGLITGENDKVRTGPFAWSLFYIAACWFYGISAMPLTVYGQNPLLWFDNPHDLLTLIPIVAAVPILVIAVASLLPNAEDRSAMTKIFCGS